MAIFTGSSSPNTDKKTINWERNQWSKGHITVFILYVICSF